MDRKTLIENFPESVVDEMTHINPLVCAEHVFFKRPTMPLDKHVNYREQAIDWVAKHKLPFQSTTNSFFELCKRYIKIVCPYCDGETEATGGGGNFHVHTTTYRCKNCKAEHNLTMQSEHLSFNPKV